jgi:hypothetical protein
VLVSVMLQPLPQPLIDKPKRKTTTSTTLMGDRVIQNNHIILVTATSVLPSNCPRIFHHHRTMMNRCKLPSIIITNTRKSRNTRQEIEVSVVGGDPRTKWSCKLHLREDRMTRDGCFVGKELGRRFQTDGSL